MTTLALVVPSLFSGGGVPAVARFLKDTVLRSNRFQLELVSLCMSSREAASLQLTRPGTWLRGAVTWSGEWEGLPYTHVGANLGELEFQRYRPRRALANALARCDLIQVVSGSPAWANAVTGLGKPVALQVATRARLERSWLGDAQQGPLTWWRRGMTLVTDRLDDRALRSVDAIQVENPAMLAYAKEVNGPRPVDVRYAPPGIDTDLFKPAERHGGAERPYILCVGRLADPRKDIGLLLRAFHRLPEPLRSTTGLVLAGASPPPPSFWQQAESLGVADRITFHDRPPVGELIELYQHATVFALPSREEGLGLVLVEALACGVPVVATRSGGPQAIVTEGEQGFLTPVGDPDSMARRLSDVLSNPALRQRLGHQARALAVARYDERVAGETFIDCWERLAHEAKPRHPAY